MERWHIFALEESERVFFCFTWRGDAQSGIRRAESDAVVFKRPDLHGFFAVRIDG